MQGKILQFQVLLDHQVQLVLRDLQVQREQLALLVLIALCLDLLVLRVRQDRQVQQVLLDLV